MSRFSDIHIEQDFWNDFIVEAFEHIDSIESNTMSLEQHPEDMEIIHTMFRAFHTIKGLAGFVEHTVVQELAHKTETLMDFCRKGELKVTTEIVNAILKTSDFIKQLCDDASAYKDDSLIEKIEAHLVVLENLSIADNQQAPVETAVNQAVLEETPSVQVEASVIEPPVEPELEFPAQEVIVASEESSNSGLEAFAQELTVIENETIEAEIKAEEIQEVQAEIEEEVVSELVAEVVSESADMIMEEVITPELNQSVVEEKPVLVAAAVANASGEASADMEKTIVMTSFQKSIMNKLKGISEKVEESFDSTAVKTVSANEEYMKVANSKIDHLVEMMSELIINQSLIEQYVFSKYNDDRQLVTNMSGFLRITRELQNLSMSLRMVSLKSTFQKVARIARDTIQELHKEVEVVMSGENTEIDRAVAEKLLDPLVHMIKNAISHGVEDNSQDRINMGKSPRAKVELNAFSKRGKIYIQVKDDGRGINTEIVHQKALEKGLIDPNRNYSEAEIKEFIMLPGFSTAKVVDNISGRGVGMDVVKTQILKIGGKVDIQSELNHGSAFVLEVPVNHAIMNGTIIDLNNQQFVVPTVNVKEFLQPQDNQWIFTKSKRTMLKVRENIIPIVPCAAFALNSQALQDEDDYEKKIPLVMVLELGQELRAIPIQNVINRQEVVVKPVSVEFSHLKFISGMSILGTGKVSLILDIDYLFRKEIKE